MFYELPDFVQIMYIMKFVSSSRRLLPVLIDLFGGESEGDGLDDLVGGGGVGVDPADEGGLAGPVGPQLGCQLPLQLGDIHRRTLQDLILIIYRSRKKKERKIQHLVGPV